MTSATVRRREPTTSWLRRGTLVAVSLAVFLVVWVANPASAAPGGLDPAFGGDGWVATDFGSGLDLAFDVAISETDGTIVAAGQGNGGRFAVARYLPTGSLDGSFSGDGRVLTNLTSGFDAAYGVAIQLDGKIVVAGRASGSGGRIALVRYDTTGSLDGTFGGGDGKVLTNVTSGDDYAWAIAIQFDQKIVVAGGAGGAGGRFVLARYDANGSLDGTFGGGDGKVLTNFTTRYDYIDALVTQPDGTIVAAGSTNYYGNTPRFALAKYQASGALDDTFGGGDGKVITNFAVGRAWAFGVAIQDDDKIVAAGQAGNDSALARYLPNGTLDTEFSGDGKMVVNVTAGDDFADEVMLQPDGKIVVAGSGNYDRADSRLTVARIQTGGGLDASFSADGKVVTNISSGLDWVTGALLQPADGKVVVVGRSGGRFLAARYLVV